MDWFRAFLVSLALALPLSALRLAADPPPILPDWETAQLFEGCAVQADSYARRLQALDRTWEVQLLTLKLPNGSKHSVVLASRGRERYLRDGTLGVFPADVNPQAAFTRRLKAWRNEHPLTSPNASRNHQPPATEAATAAAIEIAARGLATDTQRYLVVDGETRFWVVSWTTVDGQQALYHPRIGTTLTRTSPRSSREAIARTILHTLGFKRSTLIGSSQR
ncbi:hypothetical protein [Opitutus terrae]|uniref:Uncharacterized protein n=1 Tax=Opitutus terrae (strain DSM 11246 / JCM 15787 / PB90-1) TaxID=452637 RepID=B1ZQE4_OPITP|nr:hypothetical protein [Opitutus terrae]ACB73624.1 hypothetical protein Oter_0334 [Opitutus terrae PB90-1]